MDKDLLLVGPHLQSQIWKKRVVASKCLFHTEKVSGKGVCVCACVCVRVCVCACVSVSVSVFRRLDLEY